MRNLNLDHENRPITYTLTEDDKQRMLAVYEQRAVEQRQSEETALATAFLLAAYLRERGLLP